MPTITTKAGTLQNRCTAIRTKAPIEFCHGLQPVLGSLTPTNPFVSIYGDADS